MYLGDHGVPRPRVMYSKPLHPYTHSFSPRWRSRIQSDRRTGSPGSSFTATFRARSTRRAGASSDALLPGADAAQSRCRRWSSWQPGHKVACHFPISVEDLPARVDVRRSPPTRRRRRPRTSRWSPEEAAKGAKKGHRQGRGAAEESPTKGAPPKRRSVQTSPAPDLVRDAHHHAAVGLGFRRGVTDRPGEYAPRLGDVDANRSWPPAGCAAARPRCAAGRLPLAVSPATCSPTLCRRWPCRRTTPACHTSREAPGVLLAIGFV